MIDLIQEDASSDAYYIQDENSEIVGEVIMQIDNGYVALSHIDIYRSGRGHGYGMQVVEYLLDTFGPVVGESLRTSAGFWRKCISTFGGFETKEERRFGNTAFAFYVGQDPIDRSTFSHMLQLCAEY